MRIFPLVLFGCCLSVPAIAQDGTADPVNSPDSRNSEILVVAERIRGAVDAAQPPLIELDEADIASYGAGSLTELLEAIAPQTGSGRGRGGGHPVILVNGQRVSNFRELRHYSPEAIRKVEILPEEVAQRYGFAPDQRVVNFILKDNYTSREIEVEYGMPGDGGYATSQLEATWLTIDGPRRFNLNLELNDTSLLTEAERGVVQADGSQPSLASDPDPARYRSLVADSASIELDGSFTTGLGDSGASLSINGNITRENSRTLSGLDRVTLEASDGTSLLRSFNADNPLERKRRTTTYALASTLNQLLGSWQFTATLDASHARSRSVTDRRADTSTVEALAAADLLALDAPLPMIASGGEDVALSRSSSLSGLTTLAGSLLHLPAGDVSATFDLGYDWDRIVSRDTRNPGINTQLTRGDVGGGVNLAIPITSRREGVLDAIGDLTLNLNGGLNHLSDFGTLSDYSAGLTWKPTGTLTLQASYIVRDAAPSLGNLGDPQVLSFNVPVYDFVNGDTVLVTTIAGGNPLLAREKQRDIKLSANWELPLFRRSSVVLEYFRNRSDDVTASFPLLTPATEAAFADRVTRDASGQLVTLDRRAVTYDQQSSSRLRYGVDLSGQIGKAPEKAERPSGAAGEKTGRNGPDMRQMFRGRGQGQGRWNASLYHTIELENKVRPGAGGPTLDLLRGDAISDNGGVSRHVLSAQAGVFQSGIGFRLFGNHNSATRVRASGIPGSSDLRFGSLTKVDLRLFMDLGSQSWLTKEPGFLENMRVMFRVENVFDGRRKVTDVNGIVPVNYQSDLIDPVGRFFEIELRKIF